MKRLILAIAAAATTLFAPAAVKTQLDFESDGTAYKSAADKPSATANYPFAGFGNKYLELDDGYDVESVFAQGDPRVFDMYVQFTAMTEKPELPTGAKIAVCLNTNGYLYVIGEVADEIVFDPQIAENTWHRLTLVQVVDNVDNKEKYGFNIYLDGGDPLMAAGDKVVFYASTNEVATTVEFTGSGKLDNFVARTTDPFAARGERAVAVGEFATGGEYFTEVSDEAIAAAAAAGLPLKLYGNAALTATLNAGDSFTLIKGGYELTGLDDKYAVDGNTYTRVSTWSDYLGDAVAGAYEIDNLTELKAFQKGVADGLATADVTFKLTADIALDDAWPGIGLQNGKDILIGDSKATPPIVADPAAYAAASFCGTFDGQNHTISNFQMIDGLDYCGFFNSICDATIKNFKISYKDGSFAKDMVAANDACGATFVGVAKASTLQYLTANPKDNDTKEVSCTKGFGGIVGYLNTGSLVENCTNNVDLISTKNNKVGGIAMIRQNGASCTIKGCKNTGTLTTTSNQHGAIVGYADHGLTIEDCENTAEYKMLHHQGGTVTVTGTNKGTATVASYTGNATPGLNFAMVDGDVATFVADNALAAGNTYKVMASGATATYEFGAAGTIAFDTTLYTPTYAVTSDESKIVSLTDATEGSVTTYTAVAGVASVGGQAYATLQDAIDNAGDNDVITILPGIDTTQRYNVFNRGGTFKFAYDTDYMALFINGLLTADGFILQGMPVTESEDTVLVYSVVEGVAKMNSTWYASFESAYYAAPGSGATLLVKVDSDFTPTFPQASQNEKLKEFASVTFTTTSEEPIAIATSDGTTFIKSQNWSAPETATLTLASQTIASVATGTLNIPEGTTLAVASGASFANVGAITGAGVLSAVGLSPVKALQTDHVAALLADSAKWTGVVVLGDVSLGNDSLDYYGNVNSTVRLSNVNVNSLVIAGRSNNVKSLDVAGNGLTFNELAQNTTIPCALTGDGSIVVKGSAAQQRVLSFTGDCSEFAGSLTIDNANGVAKVLFGTKNTVGNGSCLTVGSDASVKVASGKTWTVPGGYVINGSVKADGALNTADRIYGSGTITSTVAQTSKVGGSWSGTYNICWAGNNDTGISFDWYGQANSKIVIPANHTLQGFIAVTANQSLTLAAGEFVVDGVLNLSNGYDYSTVGWKKISGSGTLKFAFAPSHWIKEKIEKLDGFTGSIEVSTTTQLEIAGVRVAAAPEAGARVVPITVNGSGTVGGDLKLYVGDEVQDVTLEFKADGAEGSGLYVAEPPAAKVAEIVNGEQYETLAEALEAATDGATVKLLANIAVTEMQLVTKSVTLDLNGFAITAGERSAEAAAAGDDAILCVLHGGSLTINDTSAGGTGAITGNSVFTSAVKMTKKGDTDDTKKAVLVVNGGTLRGYYYGISGNGLAGRGNTEVTINGGSVYGTCANDSVAIFQPQLGKLTINGGYLEGAMGVYVKSGTATVAINGGTIKGNGTYAAYVHSTNGFNNTGDAFVVDNAGYPGGAPAPSILGGTFVSVNASAIASYAKTGLERIVHFADKDAVTITEAKASSEDVFLEKGFPGGSDGKTFTIDTAVQTALEAKLPAGKALTDTVEGTTSGLTYAQAYALGLFDEDTETVEDVKPTIEIVDGKVVVSLDATAKAGYKVMLNVYEKSSLTAQWPTEPTTSYELDSKEEAAGFTLSTAGAGFYKVGVTIEDAE